MEEFEQLYGTIESILFSNEENGYSVIKVRNYDDEIITVTGCFPNPACGEQIECFGFWKEHPNYGKQFSSESSERYLPSDAKSIFCYLSNGAIKGIGPAIAQQIVSRFGDSSLDIILNSPNLLTEIQGISLSKATEFSNIFKRNTFLRRLIQYLYKYNIKPFIAMKLYKVYGDLCFDRLKENPYIIVDDCIGANFAEADIIAMSEGFKTDDDYRVRAATLFELKHNQRNGHCFIPKNLLVDATSTLLNIDKEIVLQQIQELVELKSLIVEINNEIEAVYLPNMYEAEKFVAQKLVDIKNNILIITGGPGTGKTTLIKSILDENEKESLKCLLVAPTGRAAKRVEEATGRQASTIHRLLGVKFSSDECTICFTKNENEKLDCDLLIMDECSMVDILLMQAILKALPNDSQLVLVGDVDQLPPIGPGNVFKAAIESGIFKTNKLNFNYRQKADSLIVDYAHKINEGIHPDFDKNQGGFYLLNRSDLNFSVDTICDLISNRLPQKMNYDVDDIQILTPSRKGLLGSKNLNSEIQKRVNPNNATKIEKLFGETIYREGDRVMQIRNNYDITWHNHDMTEVGSGIFNGDIGKIIKIDNSTQTITIDFDGKIAPYSTELLCEIEHAWATTVHKSQGSEYKVVILALSNNKMLMTRQILYTAITRAKDLLILVGDVTVANLMIDNYKRNKRYSFLCQRMKLNNI